MFERTQILFRRAFVVRHNMFRIWRRQFAFPIIGERFRPFRPEKTVHFAAVEGDMRGLPTVIQIVRQRGAMQMKWAHGRWLSRLIGKRRVWWNAVCARECSEIVIETDVLLNDVNEMLQRLRDLRWRGQFRLRERVYEREPENDDCK